MTLVADIHRSLPGFELDAELSVEPGEVLALLGPNGAGKSTALRVLAGLIPLDAGRIELDGQVLDDPVGDVLVPPERRSVGVVFQDYLLFPHLTALENVAFGLRARGIPRAQARETARGWLDRVGLTSHARLRPAALSGGQAQRVALARALATGPRVLLLDEPLAALDVGTRGEVRRDLRRHLAGFDGMCIVVTHDPVDAHALADRVVVVERGAVVQRGTLAEITAHPRSRYVAELAGVNLLAGVRRDGIVDVDGSHVAVTGHDTADGPVYAAIRPQAVALHQRPPEGSPRNVWACTVTDLDRRDDRVRVALAGPVQLTAEITADALEALGLLPGDEVWAAVKASEVVTYPR
jgi:molybdate transport system ATP-binding protein